MTRNRVARFYLKARKNNLSWIINHILKVTVSRWVLPCQSIEKATPVISLYSKSLAQKYKNFDPEKELFQNIQIQTITGCNYSCPFCPANKPKQMNYGGAKNGELMPTRLYEKIIDELAELNYSGVIEPFLMNEPTLDKRLLDLLAYTKKKLPNAVIRILSNGELLDEPFINDIMQFTDQLILNNYPVGKNIKRFDPAKLSEKAKSGIKIIDYNYKEKLTNRAGNNNNNLNAPLTEPLELFCERPFICMYIAYNGKAVLCCQDWSFAEIMGDVKEESVMSVWKNKKYEKFRNKLTKPKRIGLCKKCDYIGYRYFTKA